MAGGGQTDMRKGFDGPAAMVQTALQANPFCGHVFFFLGRRGDILKGQADTGSVVLTPAQLSMLLEDIDWRMPARTHHPELAA